ncbi:uncharacterized protein F5891DRAFT_722584 [Suillus fuscotomentosus]|uniref:Uncharacterized protein n=1 Tax=Suillus fuscotomentosus TaxID=1912939 RepID=A0AAD4EFE3_9AGAM|nr:uncharacterized protein F5891DRAFT_722584 [Suillus fuscotomentosus]KAG1905057.1 hypothetical protein F5891DRAFT_722584 [Suillus fuscotomentosus]
MLFLIVVIKVIETVVHILGRVGFDHSRWPVESGLISVLSLLGCCGPQSVLLCTYDVPPRGSYGTHHLAYVTFTALMYLNHTLFCVAGTYGYSTGFDTCP